MKLIKTLLAASVAALGLGASIDVNAQAKHGWRGGHGGHWHGHRGWYGPRLGFYIGAPLLLGSAYYWGRPWYYDEPRVIYREVIREPEVVETIREVPAPERSEAPRGQAPSQGPLYMNYCESSKAYFPKVQSCPEGWKFIAPNQ